MTRVQEDLLFIYYAQSLGSPKSANARGMLAARSSRPKIVLSGQLPAFWISEADETARERRRGRLASRGSARLAADAPGEFFAVLERRPHAAVSFERYLHQ